MERPEAEQLLLAEARRVHCEPRMTPDTIKRIYSYTSGLPYPMKLAVSQLSRRIPIGQILDASVAEDKILEALFRRSYESLSYEGKRLFLMVGNLGGGAISTIPIRTVFAAAGYKFEPALDECERSSLLAIAPEHGRECVRMPQVARKFVERQLPIAEDTLFLERDLNLIKETYRDRNSEQEAAMEWAIQIAASIATTREPERRMELVKVLEALATEFAAAWRVIVELRTALPDTPSRIREAYQRALENDPNSGELLESWAKFEGNQGQTKREVELSSEPPSKNPTTLGSIASRQER